LALDYGVLLHKRSTCNNIIYMNNSLDRKTFLKRFGLMGIAAAGASTILSACGGGGSETTPDPCKDVSGLTEQDKTMRSTLNYVNKTENPDQRCDNCQLYKQPVNGSACGGCLLFGGPVTAEGWCSSWVIKQG